MKQQTFREIWTPFADHIATHPRKAATWYDNPMLRYYRVIYRPLKKQLFLEEAKPRVSRTWKSFYTESVEEEHPDPIKIQKRVDELLAEYRHD